MNVSTLCFTICGHANCADWFYCRSSLLRKITLTHDLSNSCPIAIRPLLLVSTFNIVNPQYS